uniref:Uncharacterized protein n=1 Tax=Ciona intestinalis TaxID=7719 RepID=H2XS06_CIOIN
MKLILVMKLYWPKHISRSLNFSRHIGFVGMYICGVLRHAHVVVSNYLFLYRTFYKYVIEQLTNRECPVTSRCTWSRIRKRTFILYLKYTIGDSHSLFTCDASCLYNVAADGSSVAFFFNFLYSEKRFSSMSQCSCASGS